MKKSKIQTDEEKAFIKWWERLCGKDDVPWPEFERCWYAAIRWFKRTHCTGRGSCDRIKIKSSIRALSGGKL